MSSGAETVIVGGGIWGLSTAFHLAERGAGPVRVLERNSEVAAETTPRAAGLVGQVRSSAAMCRAVRYALDLLSGFGERSGHDPGLRRPGSLLVALTPERMAAYEGLLERAGASGVEAAFVSRGEMERLSPGLDIARLEGGCYITGDGYVDPGRCARAYAAAAGDLGVRIDCSAEVTGLDVEGGAVRGVRTAGETVPADRVVLTAGPWSSRLLRRFGADELPLQTIRHQRARTAAAGISAGHPVVRVTEVSCYVRPERGGYLYGFFEPEPHLVDFDELPEGFSTSDLDEPRGTIAEAADRLAPLFPSLPGLEVAEYSQGVTAFAPDGGYLLGPVPAVEGLYVASACAALGIAGSAAVGRWLAAWVIDGDPGEDLTEFGLGRFGERGRDPEWVRRESRDFYATYYNVR